MKDRTIIMWTIVGVVLSVAACFIGLFVQPNTPLAGTNGAYQAGAHFGTGLGVAFITWGVLASVVFTILALVAAIRQVFFARKG
jgi:hypothetical protein